MKESKFVSRTNCSQCGSSDANAIYDDEHTYCFSCGHRSTLQKINNISTPVSNNNLTVSTEYVSLTDRNITAETCKKFRVSVIKDKDTGKIEKHIYQYFDKSNSHIANKIRNINPKSFKVEGQISRSLLFGEHLFGSKGPYITITEGELDCLAAYEMLGSKYPVVSVKSATSAVADCKRSYDFLSGYENIVLCFDQDEAGRKAAENVADIFAPAQVKIVTLTLKDPCEYAKANKREQFTNQWWNHKVYTPSGIVPTNELWDLILNPPDETHVDYPWAELNTMTHGMRFGELVTFCAGSGIGKSSIIRELGYYLSMTHNEKVGMLFIEEGNRTTMEHLVGIYLNKRYNIPEIRETITKEEKIEALEAVHPKDDSRIYLYDHFGSVSSVDQIISRIRYLAKGLKCRFIILDHISILVSSQDVGDERRAIDEIMTKLRMLVQETNIHLMVVTHLKRPDGRGHEEGAHVTLAQLRGSTAIANLSDMCIGVERNNQHEDKTIRNTSLVRVLKNRFSGETGPACWLLWNDITGRLEEVEEAVMNTLTTQQNSPNSWSEENGFVETI